MLSPEQLAKFEAQLSGETSPPADAPAQESSPSEPRQPDAQEASPPTTPSEQKKPNSIPFSRFQEVNQQKRAAEKRAAELEKELEALRAKAQPERSFLEELQELEQAEKAPAAIAVPKEYDARLSQIEEAYATQVLDRLVADAKQKFPDLPETHIYAAIGEGLSVEDAYDMWEFEQFKQNRGKTATQARTPVATPPVPNKAPPRPAPKPQTMEEAHRAFRAALARK